MKKIPKVSLLCSMLVVFSLMGCATLFKAKTVQITVNSVPEGANVYLDGARVGKTPYAGRVADKTPFTLTLKKDGYEEISKRVGTHMVPMYIFAGPWMAIDAITGNWDSINEKDFNIALEPISSNPTK